jgi:hypothetical protein
MIHPPETRIGRLSRLSAVTSMLDMVNNEMDACWGVPTLDGLKFYSWEAQTV